MGAIMKTRNSVSIMRSLFLAGCIFSLLVPGMAASAERDVYRWVDEDGVVHFTQEPPVATEYETYRPNIDKVGTVAPTKPEASINVSRIQQAAETEAADTGEEVVELSEEELVIACQQAEENIVALTPVKRILVPDEADGTR